jgi:hypothetical protein
METLQEGKRKAKKVARKGKKKTVIQFKKNNTPMLANWVKIEIITIKYP